MAFTIACTKNDIELVRETLVEFLNKSRFTADIAVVIKRKARVQLSNVRLRVAKPYCGNHAGSCKLGGNKHKNLRYLEGVDWISFNEMINDAMDKINHDGDISSSVCNIRIGSLRRKDYFGDVEFEKVGQVYSKIGDLEYEQGTPGIFGYLA